MPAFFTDYDIKSILKHRFNIEVLTPIHNTRHDVTQQLEWKCPNGHIRKSKYRTIVGSKGKCGECSQIEKMATTFNQLTSLVRNRGWTALDDITTYDFSRGLKIRCNKDHIFYMSQFSIKQQRNCRFCVMNDRKLDIDHVRQLFMEKGLILISNTYEGYQYPLQSLCLNGHLNTISVHNLRFRYTSCKECLIHRKRTNSKRKFTEIESPSLKENNRLEDWSDKSFSQMLGDCHKVINDENVNNICQEDI